MNINKITEFIGVLKFTPKYAKCDPIFLHGHWTLKESDRIPQPEWKVWCNEGLYKHGINETICEIVSVDKIINAETN